MPYAMVCLAWGVEGSRWALPSRSHGILGKTVPQLLLLRSLIMRDHLGAQDRGAGLPRRGGPLREIWTGGPG